MPANTPEKKSEPRTDLDKKFLLILEQEMSKLGVHSDRAMSIELGLHPDFVNRVRNGLKSVPPNAWEELRARFPVLADAINALTNPIAPVEVRQTASEVHGNNGNSPFFSEERESELEQQPWDSRRKVDSIPSNSNSSVFAYIIDRLDTQVFEIPRQQPKDSRHDFPAYLRNELDSYLKYFRIAVQPHVDSVRKHGNQASVSLERTIVELINGINKAVDYYYRGMLLKAAKTFQDALDSIGLINLIAVETFPSGRSFYRTRYSNERALARKEIFHNPFQNRGIVTTSRYSIPGLPALYLGDSTYVCWEEANRKDFRNLQFSYFRNTEPLKVVKIQRLFDLAAELSSPNVTEERRMVVLSRYLSLFPLSIACSIKTRANDDIFKPEYIIPQLLLQYVTDKERKDAAGIMFPSTKVDYTKIQGVPAYNYVFPVKHILSEGYCSDLSRAFELTVPTSTELEALTNFSRQDVLPHDEGLEALGLAPRRLIAIGESEGSHYSMTAFGFLERVLRSRPLESLDT